MPQTGHVRGWPGPRPATSATLAAGVWAASPAGPAGRKVSRRDCVVSPVADRCRLCQRLRLLPFGRDRRGGLSQTVASAGLRSSSVAVGGSRAPPSPSWGNGSLFREGRQSWLCRPFGAHGHWV